MRVAALLLLLAVPAGAQTTTLEQRTRHIPTYAQNPYAQFKAHVARATEGVGLTYAPEIRQGVSVGDDMEPTVGDFYDMAWVFKNQKIIWIHPVHLKDESNKLCRTAYHEVIHLWMAQEGLRDVDHEDHPSWMAFFYVQGRCYGDGPDPPEWYGKGYEDFEEAD